MKAELVFLPPRRKPWRPGRGLLPLEGKAGALRVVGRLQFQAEAFAGTSPWATSLRQAVCRDCPEDIDQSGLIPASAQAVAVLPEIPMHPLSQYLLFMHVYLLSFSYLLSSLSPFLRAFMHSCIHSAALEDLPYVRSCWVLGIPRHSSCSQGFQSRGQMKPDLQRTKQLRKRQPHNCSHGPHAGSLAPSYSLDLPTGRNRVG